MKICVLGLGYIGFPTACLFANANLEVIGVDLNHAMIERDNRKIKS
jgi:UDP-N-acetyl-D-mannosaminuronic acid dehydrogenase